MVYVKDKRWDKTFLSISPEVATLLRSNRQHRNSVYGIICDDSCDDVIALYKS